MNWCPHSIDVNNQYDPGGYPRTRVWVNRKQIFRRRLKERAKAIPHRMAIPNRSSGALGQWVGGRARAAARESG